MAAGNESELSVKGLTIQTIYNRFKKEQYFVNRRYQRKLVWSIAEKEKLIDSVVKNLPIPLVLLAEIKDRKNESLEIIDGLQRLNAIVSFIENEYTYGGAYFNLQTLGDTIALQRSGSLIQREPVLDEATCLSLINYEIPFSTYKSASSSDIDEVFRRINSSGQKLSLQEIRQAGSIGEFPDLVRRISQAVRGDVSMGDVLTLNDMTKISISSRNLSYGLSPDQIFWIEQGILDRKDVRSSRDEELIVDILLDILSESMPTSGQKYRDSAYAADEEGGKTKRVERLERRIKLLGSEVILSNFIHTIDVFKLVSNRSGSGFASWVMHSPRQSGIARQFHVTFMTVYRLMHDKGMVVANERGLTEAFHGLWEKELSIGSGGSNWAARRKQSLMDLIEGKIQGFFAPSDDPVLVRMRNSQIEFENQLRLYMTESSGFELKQGFCRLDKPNSFDDKSFAKVLVTATAMVNSGFSEAAKIYFGIADDDTDANAVERFRGIDAKKVHDKFYVTGTAHDLDNLGLTIDEFDRNVRERISNSPNLNKEFATDLASSLEPFRYDGYLLWQLTVEPRSTPTAWIDGAAQTFYKRVGSRNELVSTDAVSFVSDYVRKNIERNLT